MKKQTTEISTDSAFINGAEYVPKNGQVAFHQSIEGLPYVMIRTYSAGVHFGYLKKKENTLAGIEVTLANAQRMRSWTGAMDLSQLATEGSKSPNTCKPSVVIPEITIIAIEIIPITDVAAKQLQEMTVWKS
jgi:hypothetical protein